MVHMAERMDWELRGDGGDVPAWPVVVTLLLVVVAIVATQSVLDNLSARHALRLFIEVLGGLVALVVVMVVGVLLWDWDQARQRRSLCTTLRTSTASRATVTGRSVRCIRVGWSVAESTARRRPGRTTRA